MPLQCNAVSSPVYAVTRLALWNLETSAVITFVEEVLPLHIRYIRKIPKTFVDLICIWSVFRVVSSKLLNKYIFGFLIGHLDRLFLFIQNAHPAHYSQPHTSTSSSSSCRMATQINYLADQLCVGGRGCLCIVLNMVVTVTYCFYS